MKALEKCTPLAPLHNPPNIIGIRACAKIMPGVPQVAVFRYSIPSDNARLRHICMLFLMNIMKNIKSENTAFHGTSHKYVSQQAAKFMGKASLKILR